MKKLKWVSSLADGYKHILQGKLEAPAPSVLQQAGTEGTSAILKNPQAGAAREQARQANSDFLRLLVHADPP